VTALFDRPVVRKLARYSAASVVGVAVGQSSLLLFDAGFGLHAALANFLAVAVSSVPAYLINRYWVWQKNDRNNFRREIVPFWGMAFLGLLLSTLFVVVVDDRTDSRLAVQAANLAGFGVLWVAKFMVLDKVLFAEVGRDPAEPPPLL
jgi:putative flippase GtrA